jgi:glyoxylase-like metal-dependent hydrolase (beta-lactamase superfamily II)
MFENYFYPPWRTLADIYVWSAGMAVSVHPFFDPDTCSYSYLVADPQTRQATVIDPVLNYDPESSTSRTQTADDIAALAQVHRYEIAWILETHVHADHLSAAGYLKTKFPEARVGIGKGVDEVRRHYLNSHDGLQTAIEFDALFEDGDEIRLGEQAFQVLATPGHTPACVTYRINDMAFVGDTLFMPDFGTGRCDFPGGCAHQLYRSIRRLLALPEDTRLFVGHDYAPGGRVYRFVTSVADERRANKHIRDGVTEDQFVAMRNGRDADLKAPRLLDTAVQANLFVSSSRRIAI